MDAGSSSPRRGGKPLAAVTFDDGYRDTYSLALPLLERKGIPGAVFVVTDLIGTTRLQRHDALFLLLRRALTAWRRPEPMVADALRRHGASAMSAQRVAHEAQGERFLTPRILELLPCSRVDALIESLAEEFGDVAIGRDDLLSLDGAMLAEMVRRGMVVGSHTATHPVLTLEDREAVRREAQLSRTRLERELGIEIRHFAYPGGHFDAEAVEAVAAAGYRFGYTTCFHRDRLYPELTLPRRVFWERSARGAWGDFSPAMLSCQVRGVFDPRGRCRHARETGFDEAGATYLRGAARGAR